MRRTDFQWLAADSLSWEEPISSWEAGWIDVGGEGGSPFAYVGLPEALPKRAVEDTLQGGGRTMDEVLALPISPSAHEAMLASCPRSDQPHPLGGPGTAANGTRLTTFRRQRDGAGESLVLDARASLTPAQMVDRKLSALLRSATLPISLRAADLRRRTAA
jgi:hypothetical protein